MGVRAAETQDAGVPEDGSGSHGIVIVSDAGPFTDPDGFAWEAASDHDSGTAEQLGLTA